MTQRTGTSSSGKVYSYYTFVHPEFTLVDMR
ncbi:hypothetical protein HNQ36_004982 [Afipia massiliensis]|uniref:Uncharacterized protein n=1 Tax=Afipia massiliensis TaxID=211460 RepID=A0A840NBC9_9BRAD|nr:hypothetical protein [Afipia massiliensis]